MTLRDELQSIYEEHGYLTPELLVEVARPETHPLHRRVFDRPVGEAAESWYRHRAHELIQSVRVTYKPQGEDGPTHSVRAFTAVRQPGVGAIYNYKPVGEVVEDPVTREIVLREMEREWKNLFERYRHFEEFSEMVAASLAN